MKIKTQEAAKKLNMHPSLLFLNIAELDPSLNFNEIWPEIDEAWVDTISQLRGKYPVRPDFSPESQTRVEAEDRSMGLSKEARKLIDKLRRHKKWGHVSVPFDALVKMTNLSFRELHQAVDELQQKNLLDHAGGSRGTVSLNSSKKSEIESIR